MALRSIVKIGYGICVHRFVLGRGLNMQELKVYHSNEWHNEYTDFYLKSEADAVLAAKDAEIRRLQRCEIWMKQHFYCEEVIACESAKNRRLRRALWLARAESAKNAKCKYHRLAQKEVCDPQPHGWSCYITGEVYPTGKMSRKLEPHYWCDIWDEVERKCRAKAEEYK